MGSILLFLVIEASRRHVGMSIVAVTVFFLIYVYAGPWFPGFLNHAPFSVGEIINIQYLDLEGVWGSPIAAAAGFVIVFLIFAGLLMETGVLDVFMNFTMKLVGKSTGGPAKVAVISSGLVGMVNGTAVGNALLVGQVSIPLMKKLGWPTIFCNSLDVADDGEITGFRMRVADSKLNTVKALQSIGFETIAAGDSYNDLAMIQASRAGFLFKTTDKFRADYPELPSFETYDELMAGIRSAMEMK